MTTSTPKKQLHLGLFMLPEPMHGGQWAYPGNQSERIGDPDFWGEIAEALERGKADFFFFGDGYGYTLIDGKRPDVSSRDCLDLPRVDPGIMIAAIAHRTKHLGFVMTGTTTFEPPFSFARRISTLDHVTNGRFGWNIVTSSWQESAANAFGVPVVDHDERYVMADEHLNIVYGMLEESWEDDALVLDRENGVFADPSKIHQIDFEGKYYRAHGVNNTPPSAQRMPVLLQAGSSPAGVAFGSQWTEVAFILGTTDEAAKRTIQSYREAAAAAGRNPDHLRYMTGVSIVIGETTEAARQKHADLVSMNTIEAAIASYANFTGLNLADYDLDTPLTELRGKGQMFSQVERYLHANPNATVQDIIDGHRVHMGARGFHAIGTVEEVVDRLEQLADEVGFDGFLIEPYVLPQDAHELADVIIPELRRRGRFRHEYEEGTFRERLFGTGNSRLAADYPAKNRDR